MTYHNEILNVYESFLKKADDLLRSSHTIKEPYHFIETYNPFRGQQAEKDGLFDELTSSEKVIYHQAIESLRHKTPFNPKIEEETVRTSQISWLEKQLEETAANGDIRPIVFLGPKGSGKTTSLNYAIAKINKEYQNKRILMIRGNAEEYCRIKQEFYSEDTPLWDIREYMKHHTANLLAMHSGKEPFKKIVSDISDRLISQSFPIGILATPVRKASQKGDDVKIKVSTLIDAIAEQCRLLQTSGFPYGESMITYELKKKVSLIEKQGQKPQFHTSWPALWSSLSDYFQEQNIRIFFVFDGLDNVWSFGDEEKRAYQSTIKDLAKEFRNYYGNGTSKAKYRFSYVLACRPESFQQLNENISRIGNDECLFRYEAKQNTEHVDNIVIEKFSALKQRILALQKQSIDDTKGGRFYQALMQNEFSQHLASLSSDTEVASFELFGRNTRGVIYNFLSFAIFISFYSKEVSSGKMPPQVTEYHIFIRNLFFGGRRFVRTVKWTRDYQWKHSVIFPNIFHIDLTPIHIKKGDVSNEVNPLLCGIRLLDELAKAPLTDNGIISVLNDGYSYDKLIINNVVHLFLQFRLIEPVEPEPGQVFANNTLRTLPSAKVLRHILNHHIDILAYLAFDAILPKRAALWIFEGVDLSKYNSEYLSSTVVVGLKFIAFLNALSSTEGSTRTLFPIDGHLKRIEYLLAEWEKTIGKPKVREFLQSL